MKYYTLKETAEKMGQCKSAVFYQVVKRGLGKRIKVGKKEIILLSEKDLKSLVFRAKNKKKYIYNLQSKKIKYEKYLHV